MSTEDTQSSEEQLVEPKENDTVTQKETNKRNQLYLVVGDKGGVGKTTFALGLVEGLLERNVSPASITVADGDPVRPLLKIKIGQFNTWMGTSNPELSEMRYSDRQFGNQDNVVADRYSGDRIGESPNVITTEFLSYIMPNNSEGAQNHVIVNMPSGSNGLINLAKDYWKELLNEAGYDLNVFWLLWPQIETEHGIDDSLESGIMSVATRNYAVYPRHLRSDPKEFDWQGPRSTNSTVNTLVMPGVVAPLAWSEYLALPGFYTTHAQSISIINSAAFSLGWYKPTIRELNGVFEELSA